LIELIELKRIKAKGKREKAGKPASLDAGKLGGRKVNWILFSSLQLPPTIN
jgi:hypothetical protein